MSTLRSLILTLALLILAPTVPALAQSAKPANANQQLDQVIQSLKDIQAKLRKDAPTANQILIAGPAGTTTTYTVETPAQVANKRFEVAPDKPKDSPKPTSRLPKWNDKRIAFEIRGKPWAMVFEWFSYQTGLPYSSSMAPPLGTFHFINPRVNGEQRKYTLAEIFDILNEVLQGQHKLTLLHLENSLTLIPSDDFIPPILVPYVDPKNFDEHAKSEIVKMRVHINTFNADEFAPEAKKMLGDFGQIFVMNESNDLILQAPVNSLREVVNYLQTNDRSLPTKNDDAQEPRIFIDKPASARMIADLDKKLDRVLRDIEELRLDVKMLKDLATPEQDPRKRKDPTQADARPQNNRPVPRTVADVIHEAEAKAKAEADKARRQELHRAQEIYKHAAEEQRRAIEAQMKALEDARTRPTQPAKQNPPERTTETDRTLQRILQELDALRQELRESKSRK